MGLQGYSTPNSEHVLFCSEFMESARLYLYKQGLEWIECRGRYKGGKEERTLAVTAQVFWQNIMRQVPWLLSKQESVLHLGVLEAQNRRKATLIYLADGRREHIGTWLSTTRADAESEGSYTRLASTHDFYWVVKMDPPASPGHALLNKLRDYQDEIKEAYNRGYEDGVKAGYDQCVMDNTHDSPEVEQAISIIKLIYEKAYDEGFEEGSCADD